MVRAVTIIAGLLLAMPTLLFFWIGAQTFIRPLERMLAVTLATQAAALLALSLILVFTPVAQRMQAVLLGTTTLSLLGVFAIYRFSK